jgi:hypothetical protein
MKSNTNISNDPELIVMVVREMLQRQRLVLLVPLFITQDEYNEMAAGKPEQFDPVAIADWISIIPDTQPTA